MGIIAAVRVTWLVARKLSALRHTGTYYGVSPVVLVQLLL